MNKNVKHDTDGLPARSAVRLPVEATEDREFMRETTNYGIDSLTPGKTPDGGGERVGARRLDVLRMSLSDRDIRILRSLAQHRFLTTEDLQNWHFSDHASNVTAARTCRRVLARLRDGGALKTLDRRVGGFAAGSTRNVWHLTPVGERLVRGTASRRVREPSPAFLSHELGVAELHISLIEADRERKLSLLDFTTEPSCWRKFTGVGGSTITLKPDFFAALRAHPEYESLYFGEYDRGTESVQTIVKKASVYEAYWRTGKEEQRSGAFPIVLWITPDTTRKHRLQKALGRSALISSELHQVITTDEFIPSVLAEDGGQA